MYPETYAGATLSEVKKVAKTIIADCMGVRPGESVLVVTDTVRKDLGMPIYQAALETSDDVVYLEMKPESIRGGEPPKMVADAMYEANVIVAMMRGSLSHTRAKIRAVGHGARIATMPFGSGSTEFVTRIFTRGGMTVDFNRMRRNIHRILDRLKGTVQARVTAEKGTDVVIDYGGRRFYEDSGIARDPGNFTNLPAGEVFVAPVNANGVIVIDLTMGRLGLLESPLELYIRDGMAYAIKGERAGEVERILRPFGPMAMNLAEFAIGMNPKAYASGLLLEDEKIGNTVHFALGNNAAFGGDVRVGVHMDGVVTAPTIYIDGEKMYVGKYL